MQSKQIYKCLECGNVVELLVVGGGELVCCGDPMVLEAPNTVDASKEKHVPVIERTAGGVKIKVGSVPHPMEEKHFIMWIEITSGGVSERVFLRPGDSPEAEFKCATDDVRARIYCNLHGLWQSG